jgi:hypothetical protein
VHPDETSTCVDLYISGMVTARLATIEGDQVTHLASSEVGAPSADVGVTNLELETVDIESEKEACAEADDRGEGENEVVANVNNVSETATKGKAPKAISRPGPQAVFNVNVTLDSSLDIEKLQKQLELLKLYGAI